MRCVADAMRGLRQTAYAHHIVRLMVFGNLTLLLGVRPELVYDWFHHSFIDGYPWVMAPNALGMATYADGGAMMTKPYAASDACPFTTLYWDFLDRNRERLPQNRRMRMPYRNLERIPDAELQEIRSRARELRRGI
jgi:deoxyribodipyrimidine photolyase-related protein